MKYGIALPYANARMVAKLSQLAEEAGWDGVFLGDAIWCQDPMIGLAAAAKQIAKGEVQLNGFRINACRLYEGLYGLVRLLIEQKIQALEIGSGQRPRFLQQVLDVNARGNPAQRKKGGQHQQPP